MKRRPINQLQLEYVLRHLPDKSPPSDLRKSIMSAMPEYKKPWFKRARQFFIAGPIFFRTSAAIASLLLAFYGGMQIERFSQRDIAASGELTLAQVGISDEAYYHLGRSLLATGQAEEALSAFRSAELLRPDTPKYTLWKGAAYRSLGATDKERQSYRKVISSRPDLLPPRLRLANSLLQEGKASEAEQLYNQILESNPTEKRALYNRALSLRMQGNSSAETEAWKGYLSYYRTGPPANRALRHLHELKDFSFRIYQLGHKSIILNQERLLDPLDTGMLREVNYLVRHFKNRSLSDLSIVVFIKDDIEQAKNVAKSLRMAISDQTEGREKAAVRISWFDEAEPIETPGKKKSNLSKGVLIFSSYKNNPIKQERI